MEIGDRVEIKEFHGKWKWVHEKKTRFGRITGVDEHCYSVRTDDGEDIRDVHSHFRATDHDDQTDTRGHDHG